MKTKKTNLLALKKLWLSVVVGLAAAGLAGAQERAWRYRGEAKLSAGTEVVILPSVAGVSTTHGALYDDRLFVGVEAGFQAGWAFTSDCRLMVPAFVCVERRFPFRKNDRNAFLVGCGLGGMIAVRDSMVPAETGTPYGWFRPVLKIPVGLEFRLGTGRSALAVMLEVIPVSFKYSSCLKWDPWDTGARLSVAYRF